LPLIGSKRFNLFESERLIMKKVTFIALLSLIPVTGFSAQKATTTEITQKAEKTFASLSKEALDHLQLYTAYQQGRSEFPDIDPSGVKMKGEGRLACLAAAQAIEIAFFGDLISDAPARNKWAEPARDLYTKCLAGGIEQ
jgi:hypothetical protein